MNPWYVTIRNISVLIGVAIATVAVWILSVLPLMLHQSWATFVILPTGHCGVTSIDLTITTIFAGWTFILGRLSRFIFVGRFASWFRLASFHILHWPLVSLLLLGMSTRTKYRMPRQ